MTADIERIADTRCEVGEGPLWHPTEDCLFWCDIFRGHLYRYDPTNATHERVYEDSLISGFTIQEDGSLLLFGEHGSVRVWDGEIRETLIEEIPEERDGRFNDVIADPEGRVYAGTVPTDDHLARVYRIDPDGSYSVVLKDFDLPNGMGFTPDHERMYVADTGYFENLHPGRIYSYDYERESGELTDREILVEASDEPGMPDGLTVDAEGHVWSAYWDGGCVVRYSPEGEEELRIEFPATKVACPTFGGREYDALYVTTAGGEDRSTEGEGAGAVFRCDTPYSGAPEYQSAVMY